MTCANIASNAPGLGKILSVGLECSLGFPSSYVLDPFCRHPKHVLL